MDGMERLRRGPARPARRHAIRVAVGAVAVALMATGALAQEAAPKRSELVGTVADLAGRPLVGAFVSVAGDDWGCLTAENGRFVLRDVGPGPITLHAELLGYETLTWQGTVEPGRPVSLTLTARPILLEGLTVVADRFESRRRATATTVRWYDRDALSTSAQPTALDFVTTRAGLARVPCRSVWSDQCFLVRGRVTVPSVWIDEVPVIGGMEYLEMFQPHELYMVEVYGGGRHVRAYTNQFMARAAETRLRPIPFIW